MEQNDLQRALMAVLFAAGEPVAASRLAESLQVDESEIHRECEALISALSYHRSGIRIVKLEDAYQMCSSAEMAEYVTKTLETRKPPKLSPSQLETLTVIAYYQTAPIPSAPCSRKSSSANVAASMSPAARFCTKRRRTFSASSALNRWPTCPTSKRSTSP